MASFFESTFDFNKGEPNIGIIAPEGAKELAEKVDYFLVKMYNEDRKKVNFKTKEVDSFLINTKCPRFTTGDGKAIINETVRGKDVYIVTDVGNYSCTYSMFGMEVPMSPDDHYADLKRILSAIAGKANRITLIMPMLYGGRQHRRNARESLDCAMMLQEMESMGVRDIITFDAHDPRVQNAIPLMGFDNFFPTYQILKALLGKYPDTKFDKDHFMVVSPDEGAMSRNIYYASELGLDLGMFYKRRDYSTIINGRNPIVAHEYIGNSVKNKDVFVADDIIATGDSILRLASDLKKDGANRIFISSTFALFTEGIERFNKAYKEGLFTALLSTNLTYLKPELKKVDWFIEADMSKFIAYIIAASAQDKSFSVLLAPHEKISDLIKKNQ